MASTVAVENLLGGRWLIRVSETGISSGSKIIDFTDPNGDQIVEAIPLRKFRLVQVETYKISGDAATIQPLLERYLADGVTLRKVFQQDPVTNELYTFAAAPIIYASKLKHTLTPDTGSNNAAWTEYMIEAAD